MSEAEESGTAEDHDDLPEQLRIRREKYDRLVAQADPAPYPARVARTASLAQVRDTHPQLAADTATGEQVGVTGRVIFVRNTGKLCFAMLREGDAELQVMLSRDRVGATALAAWKTDVDLGDLVFVHGEVISSRRGELSVLADEWSITAKALRPLPVAHRPLSDENRVRERYVDLIVRPDARRMLRLRADVLHSLRDTLRAGGYVEIETPVLQSVHGGAAARPFHTHLNAFDQQMSLRIATELYLKRVLVGGIERVYEIGPVFRNEGIDSRHSPEYTLLEAYEAYGDVHTMAALTQQLIVRAAADTNIPFGRTPGGAEIDLAGQWRVAGIYDLVSEAVDEQVTPDTEAPRLRQLAAARGVETPPDTDAAHLVLELFDELVEHTLQAPTFVADYPAAVRPLARVHRDDPRLSEAWDLLIGGVEVGHPVSELVDPVEQRRRLTAQSHAAAQGDPEAMALDEEFLRAMELALPPSGGTGLGIDRLLMLLTGQGIRETILFPLVKPQLL